MNIVSYETIRFVTSGLL